MSISSINPGTSVAHLNLAMMTKVDKTMESNARQLKYAVESRLTRGANASARKAVGVQVNLLA